jgi:hypothetical protein
MILKKTFLLVFLLVSITLPMVLSFATAFSSKEIDDKACVMALLSMTEEETKEDEGSFDKEKNFISITFTISPYIANSKPLKYFSKDLQAITGNPALHYTPPELS